VTHPRRLDKAIYVLPVCHLKVIYMLRVRHLNNFVLRDARLTSRKGHLRSDALASEQGDECDLETSKGTIISFFVVPLDQRFPNFAPRTLKDLRSIPRDPWIQLYNGYFEVYLRLKLKE
jgi:hypothetical protein